ncbi:MAG: hypothetical protein R3B74_14045, partial [Nitrospirales bacterium]|nr:hypothetical protein [Nitrospirales bacterium]
MKDMGLGFLGTLVSLAVCLFVPKVVDLKGLFWFLLIPFCFYLTVMVIALLGKKKGSYGVPIGIMGFFLCWAAVALYQEQQATNFASRVENQSTPLKWEALPKAILTGNPVQPWSCKKDCTEALINGLPVFTRYYRGIHRISLGSGEKCWHPKAIRTKMLIGNYLPEDKCFIAEDVSEEVI